jgi:hypothetical protein
MVQIHRRVPGRIHGSKLPERLFHQQRHGSMSAGSLHQQHQQKRSQSSAPPQAPQVPQHMWEEIAMSSVLYSAHIVSAVTRPEPLSCKAQLSKSTLDLFHTPRWMLYSHQAGCFIHTTLELYSRPLACPDRTLLARRGYGGKGEASGSRRMHHHSSHPLFLNGLLLLLLLLQLLQL